MFAKANEIYVVYLSFTNSSHQIFYMRWIRIIANSFEHTAF